MISALFTPHANNRATNWTTGLATSRADVDVLPRCLLLAVLLHVWLALMVGTRSGPALPGQSSWGSLNVTLRGTSGWSERSDDSGQGGALSPSDRTPDHDATAPRWRDDGALGQARSSRHGGVLRREPPPPDSGPGAQSQGRWKAQALTPDASRPELETPGTRGDGALEMPAPPPPAPAAKSEPVAAVTAVSPVAAVAPVITSTVLSLPQATAPKARSSSRLAAVEAIRASDPPGQAALQATPSRIELPPAELAQPTPPTEATPPQHQPAPEVQPQPEPTLRTLAAPAVARRRASIESLPAAAVAAPPAVPLARELPTTLPEPPQPVVVPAALPSAVPAAATTSTTSPQAVASPTPTQELKPAASAAPAPGGSATQAAAPTTAAPSAPTALKRGDPLADAVAGPRASSGAPDAGARVGHDVATAPSASASAPLAPLNLSLPRGAAAATRRGPGMLDLLPAPPERKSKLEKAVDEASRDDCRSAHGDKGLLGVVPLALDSLRGKGCKW